MERNHPDRVEGGPVVAAVEGNGPTDRAAEVTESSIGPLVARLGSSATRDGAEEALAELAAGWELAVLAEMDSFVYPDRRVLSAECVNRPLLMRARLFPGSAGAELNEPRFYERAGRVIRDNIRERLRLRVADCTHAGQDRERVLLSAWLAAHQAASVLHPKLQRFVDVLYYCARPGADGGPARMTHAAGLLGVPDEQIDRVMDRLEKLFYVHLRAARVRAS